MLLTTGLGIGGAEMVVRDLARALDRTRFKVSICCLKVLGPIGRELAAEGIDIYVLPAARAERPDYLTSLKLRRTVREKKVDLVHSHTTYALTDASICRTLTPSIKVVHTFHFGNYPHRPRQTLLIEAVCTRLVDQLVAVGEVQRDQIRRTYRLSDRAICAVRNGVHLPSTQTDGTEFRTRVGANGKILVGTIATLIPQKGLFDLLAVARRVRDIRDDVQFVIVGEGELRADLERRRHALGLHDAVTFTGWLTNAASVALPAFDIYFQPSHWEAMSISILEAMAARKPVVSTAVGEAPHLIQHESAGFLSAVGDIDSMAATIVRLATSENIRRSVGERAGRTVANQFTVSHMTRAYEHLYLNVLGWNVAAQEDVRR